MKRMSFLGLATAVVLMAACDTDGTLGPTSTAFYSSGESGEGVEPIAEGGNISGGAAGVCAAVDTEDEGWLVGEKWEDTSLEPLAGETFSSFGFTFDVSADGKYLDWTQSGNIMKAVVVKGGPGFHTYYYNPEPHSSDTGLHSPLNNGGNVPEISWFAFCYVLGSLGDEGCGAGFWRNNAANWDAGQWPSGYAPGDAVTDLFDVPAGFTTITGATLEDALGFGGGGGDEGKARQLVRQAVAAVLNAAHPDVDYPRTVGDISDDVDTALAGTGNDMETLKDALDADNNLGCPLSQN